MTNLLSEEYRKQLAERVFVELIEIANELSRFKDMKIANLDILKELNSGLKTDNYFGQECVVSEYNLQFEYFYHSYQSEGILKEKSGLIIELVKEYFDCDWCKIPKSIGEFDGMSIGHESKKALNAFYNLLDGILNNRLEQYLPMKK